MFPKNDENIEILGELHNPWKSGKGMHGVNFDGDQTNGKNGSPIIPMPDQIAEVIPLGLHEYQKHEPKSEGDGHKGVNWDNTQPDDVEDQAWEKSHGVAMKSEGHFKDIHNGFEAKEVNFSGDLDGKSIGMPPVDESLSPDCGRY
jgi:hypothetical protein